MQVVHAPEAALLSAAEPNAAAPGASADTEPLAAEADSATSAGGAGAGERIQIVDMATSGGGSGSNGSGADGDLLLELQGLTLRTPDGATTLVQNLDLQVDPAAQLLGFCCACSCDAMSGTTAGTPSGLRYTFFLP